jgi:hypothetical protein
MGPAAELILPVNPLLWRYRRSDLGHRIARLEPDALEYRQVCINLSVQDGMLEGSFLAGRKRETVSPEISLGNVSSASAGPTKWQRIAYNLAASDTLPAASKPLR